MWLNFFVAVGVPIRGGVEVGLGVEMFEHEYYGRVLVDAYLIESTAADYPRVLVGPRLLNYLAALERGPFTDERLATPPEGCSIRCSEEGAAAPWVACLGTVAK